LEKLKMKKISLLSLILLSLVCLGEACTASDSDDNEVTDPIESPDDVTQAVGCNGSELLCDRSFSEVCFATAHNAMNNAEDDWTLPNQNFNIETQLADGIRSFMLDSYMSVDGIDSEDWGKVFLCHGPCSLGNVALADVLAILKNFMDANPKNILSIIFEAHVVAAEMEREFEEAGMIDYLYAHTPGSDWPTLQQMIDAGTTLVIFTEDNSATEPAWYHVMYDHAWDTPYHAEYPEEISCTVGRGSIENDLTLFNHFLTAPLASPELAEQVNYNPFFIDRVNGCIDELGRTPNFIAVDFYSIGDVLEVIDEVNGL
jgi:hypothetical protein